MTFQHFLILKFLVVSPKLWWLTTDINFNCYTPGVLLLMIKGPFEGMANIVTRSLLGTLPLRIKTQEIIVSVVIKNCCRPYNVIFHYYQMMESRFNPVILTFPGRFLRHRSHDSKMERKEPGQVG